MFSTMQVVSGQSQRDRIYATESLVPTYTTASNPLVVTGVEENAGIEFDATHLPSGSETGEFEVQVAVAYDNLSGVIHYINFVI